MNAEKEVSTARRRRRVSVSDIKRVAEAVYSARQWATLFGKKYYYRATVKTVTRWCSDGILPTGWKARKHGSRFHIFYTGEEAPAEARRKRRGQQRRAAPSIDFGDVPPIRLSTELVEAVFNRLLTAAEWNSHFGSKDHGINSLEYVYQMCAEVPNERAGHTPAKLPEGWHPLRIGGTWLIYHTTLNTRRTLLSSNTSPTHTPATDSTNPVPHTATIKNRMRK